MKKETAVDWLVEELNKETGITSFVADCDDEYKSTILSIIQQAKEMEKQQIIDAWENGYKHGACVNEDKNKFHGIQYYNENKHND
jgi:hypothetical protein